MLNLRNFCIVLAATAHFYLFLLYKALFNSKINYPAILFSISNWRRLISLGSQQEHRLAFRVVSKLARVHRLKNKCLGVSVVMYWLSADSATICFSLNEEAEEIMGHAWIELDQQVFTTSVEDTKWPIYSLKKRETLSHDIQRKI